MEARSGLQQTRCLWLAQRWQTPSLSPPLEINMLLLAWLVPFAPSPYETGMYACL